ncbi:terpene synthase family protein [Chryseobacterium lathyri]|uniref:Uncharacterized protein n=1 Tax=Chryseobacterium lathyri TaxID=395933 RepID=A0ABT9SMB3_9FLAO|nr:terpene synthase family protein [Chryseobacterium lathyri]MDP9960573.1 hypothetical protein [Chryseobacterium lathyri]MDQ0067181.1 hypothetical protein [Chryseobacterium lathyri]
MKTERKLTINPKDFFPPGYYPWADGFSSPTELMKKAADDWYNHAYSFLSTEAKEKYKEQFLHVAASRMTSEAASIPDEHIIPCNRWMIWMTVFDDVYGLCSLEKLEKISIQINSIFQGRTPEAHEDGLFHEAAIMRNEFMSFLPEEWMLQFIENMNTYVKYGLIEECQYSRLGKIPPPYLF